MSWKLLPHAYKVRVKTQGRWEDALAWGVNIATRELQVTKGTRVLGPGDRPAHSELRIVALPDWISEDEAIPFLGAEQG